MPSPTKAAQDSAATDAAVTETADAAITQTSTVPGDVVTRSTEALTSIVQSATGKARELFDGLASEFKKVTGLTVDADHGPGLYLGDPTARV